MLEIFHQSKDFFQLKELEKIAPKEKVITMQSVKEVVQSLVDDHLVDTEKIGNWSLKMSKKRGLSAEEKKVRMLEIFHQSKDFFQLKELEKIAPKEKGITMQSVKEVVQSLVDDHLVDTEKIGTSIYFWSFPSKAKNSKRRKLNELQTEFEEVNKKIKKAEENIATESVDREPTEERTQILTTLQELSKKEIDLKKELEKYRDCDPEYITQLKSETEDLKGAINRWTENIYILKSYMKNTFQVESEVINQNFEIPPDMDYIED